MFQRRVFLGLIFSGLLALNFPFQNCADVEFGLVDGSPLEGLSGDFEIGDVVEPIPVTPVVREQEVVIEDPGHQVVDDDSNSNQNDGEQHDSEQADSGHSDSGHSDSGHSDSGHSDSGHSDSENIGNKDSETVEDQETTEDREIANEPPGQDLKTPEPGNKEEREVSENQDENREDQDERREQGRDQIDLACGISGLEDIRVNIRDVYLGRTAVHSVYGMRSLAELAEGLPLYVATATRASQISIVLEAEGNQLVDAEGRSLTLELKTPAAQQSGLKLNLRGTQQFQANSDYVVQFDLSSVKLVQAGKSGKCILTPSITVHSVEKK